MARMKFIREVCDVQKHVKFETDEQESFTVLMLNSKNGIINQKMVFLGTVNACPVHPREIFKDAIRNNSVAIILVHNHPSGDPKPSDEDKQITRILVQSGKLLGIEVLDHVIIGGKKYFSFLEADIMPK